jgi:site-specific recombinase XerD
MREPWNVRVKGPLAAHATGFQEHVVNLGYAPPSVDALRRLLTDLSGWLDARGLGLEPLATEEVDEFLADRRRNGIPLYSRRGLRPLLGYLDGLGLLPTPVVVPTRLEVLLGDYRGYLIAERSLAALTVLGYMKTATLFGTECLGVETDRCADLSGSDVAAFLRWAGAGHKPKTVNNIVIELRSFLRFLYATGQVDVPLWEAALGMASWRGGPLPRRAPAGAAEAILASCDRTTLLGARDFAMIILIARLGLRAGEVATLTLDDLRWGAGEVIVHGKGGTHDALPLPVDVGEALADYLCLRGPRSSGRQMFLHVKAPRSQVAMTDVRCAVRRACWRAGLADTGTHRFRHSLATEMLARGAPLAEIGEILRHRDLETTALYAKVDRAALTTVARPWPGSRP